MRSFESLSRTFRQACSLLLVALTVLQWNEHVLSVRVHAFTLPSSLLTSTHLQRETMLRADPNVIPRNSTIANRIFRQSAYNVGPQGYSRGFRDDDDRKAKEWLRKERYRERDEDGYASMFRKRNTIFRKLTKPLRTVKRNIIAPNEPGMFSLT